MGVVVVPAHAFTGGACASKTVDDRRVRIMRLKMRPNAIAVTIPPPTRAKLANLPTCSSDLAVCKIFGR